MILGFIGIFNFINVMSVGIMSRKREFTTLESIGMSTKQMRSMIRNEGIGYAVLTILFALTFGNGIVYAIFLIFKNLAGYATFTYPILPVVILCVAISLICLITPDITYHNISKQTLVERLRESE